MAAQQPSQNDRSSGGICIGKLHRMSGVTWWASQVKRSGSITSSRKQRLNLNLDEKTVNQKTSSNGRGEVESSKGRPAAVQTQLQFDQLGREDSLNEDPNQTHSLIVPGDSISVHSPKTLQSQSSSASTAPPAISDSTGQSNNISCQPEDSDRKPSWCSALSEVTTLRQAETWFDDSEESDEATEQTWEPQSPNSQALKAQQDNSHTLTDFPSLDHPPPTNFPLSSSSLLSLERKTSSKLDNFNRSQHRQDIRLRDVESNTAGLIRRAADQATLYRDQREIIDQLQISCDLQFSSIARLQQQLEVVNQTQRITEFALYSSEGRCAVLEKRVKALEELVLRGLRNL